MMSRADFRRLTFERDGHTCLVPECGLAAVDPHHILDRELWLDTDPYPEGYLLANGASLCEEHHLDAEAGHFPPQALRRWLSLEIALPQQLDPARIWDKWGQEIERSTLEKYPRTPYFNFSQTQDAESGYIDTALLFGKPLVVTAKMDGSNVTLTREKVAARNGQHATHPSFNYLKQLHAGFAGRIPVGLKLFGEWLFVRHSIAYEGKLALPSYLQIFAAYDTDTQLFWPWGEVAQFCDSQGFTTVPVLCRGQRFQKEWELIKEVSDLAQRTMALGHEGLVVKNMYPFHFSQHAANAAKIVRPNHIQTDQHWDAQPMVKNHLLFT